MFSGFVLMLFQLMARCKVLFRMDWRENRRWGIRLGMCRRFSLCYSKGYAHWPSAQRGGTARWPSAQGGGTALQGCRLYRHPRKDGPEWTPPRASAHKMGRNSETHGKLSHTKSQFSFLHHVLVNIPMSVPFCQPSRLIWLNGSGTKLVLLVSDSIELRLLLTRLQAGGLAKLQYWLQLCPQFLIPACWTNPRHHPWALENQKPSSFSFSMDLLWSQASIQGQQHVPAIA